MKGPLEGSLVLYKNRPACVKRVEDKLEIELEGGETMKVRPKDVVLLHPGPVGSLDELQPQSGEVQTAWEMLAGSRATLPELAELIYEAYTPATAWATWQLVSDGLYFQGTPEEVVACTPEQVAQKQAAREAMAAEKQAWEAFLERARAGRMAPEDGRYLRDVEDLAFKRSVRSRVLRELGYDESPENAHALLLELGYWDDTVNPYPQRFDLTTSPPTMEPPELADEARVDLTHLPAYAIDNEGTQTPDDALSLEGNRLWVHVADAAALVGPGSAIDLDARARGASIHLPEKVVHMLPKSAIQRLGLGLADVSPALSFGLDLDLDGQIIGTEVVPSWARVTRLTYEEAETQLEQEPFKSLNHLAQAYRARRRASGAVFIEFPEVDVRVEEGQISLRLLPPLKSRTLVQEAMIMAGEAVARFALERDIPIPFATQESSDADEQPESLSEMYAFRRTLKRSQYRGVPAPHAGMGLELYAQATSPLRRYLDLVVHQQLRAHLQGGKLLGAQEVLERIGTAEAVIGSVRQVEQLSNRHWTLAYLLRNPKWCGEGIVVERRGSSSRVLIAELGLEVQVHLPTNIPLDSTVPLLLRGVTLAQLEAHFRVKR
jgi:exoribonuclease-2